MAKTRLQKAELFDLYSNTLNKGTFILVKLSTKLPAKAVNAYRLFLSDKNGKMHVLKNRIFLRALNASEAYKDFAKDLNLTGNIALITSDDIVSALKGLEKMQESAKELLGMSDMPEEDVKKYVAYDYEFGFVESSYVNPQDLKMLSTLPSIDALYGMLAGGLKSLLTGLASALSGNVRNLAYALNQVAENKQE